MPKRMSAIVFAEVEKLYQQEYTDTEIADILQISRSTVRRWRIRNNLVSNNYKYGYLIRKPVKRNREHPLIYGTFEDKQRQFLQLLNQYDTIAKQCGKKLNIDIFLSELRALARE